MSVAASSASSTAPVPIRPASHKRTPSGFSAYALNAHGLPQFSPTNMSRSVTSANGMSWSETFDFTSRSPLNSSLHFANHAPGTSPMSFSASLSCSPGFTAFYGFGLEHFQLEQEFCQNFTCCGLSIPNFHELVNHFESAHVVPTDELGRPLPCSPLGAAGHSAAPVLTPQQISKLVQQHNQQQQQVLQQQGQGLQQQQFGGIVDDAASPQSSIGPTTPPSTHSFASGVVAAYEQQSQIAQPQPQSQHQAQALSLSHQHHASQQNSPMSPNQNFASDSLDQYQHHDGSAAYQEAQSPQAHAQAQMMQLAQAHQQQQQMQMQMAPQGQIPYTAASQSQQQQQYGLDDATSPMASGLSIPSVPAIPAPNYAQGLSQAPHMQTVMQQQQQQLQMTGAFNGFRSALPASPPQDAFGMTSVVRRRTSPVSLGSPTSALSAHSSLSSLSMYSAASGALSRANSLGSITSGPGAALSSARGPIDEDDVMMDFDPLDDAPFISHAAHSHASSPVAMHPRRTISPTEQPQVCLPPALFSAPTPSPGLAGTRNGYFDESTGRSRSRGGASTPASRAASPGGRVSGVVRTKSSKSASKDTASASGSGSGSGSGSNLGTNLLLTGAAAEKQRLKAKLAVLDPLAIRERMGEAKEAKEPASSAAASSGGREGKGGRRSREKGYKCPIPGCTKSYLNPNGLKYHLNKGTCTIASGAGSGSGSGSGVTASMPSTPAVSTPPSMVGTPMASAPASPILEEQDALIAHTQQHLVSYQSQHSELQNALMPTY